MRRGFGIWMLILLIIVGIGIGVGAYNWGLSEGLEQSGRAVEVVRYHGPVFFPFGLILFPLFLFGIFALMRGAWWSGRGWGGPGHHGGGPSRLEEWHRGLHERDSGGGSGSPGESGAA